MDLSRSESDLAAIYDAMACGVVVRNAAGAVVFANAAAKRIFGRPPEELEGREAPGEDRRVREDGTTMPDDEVPNVAAQARGEPIRNVMMGMVRADGQGRVRPSSRGRLELHRRHRPQESRARARTAGAARHPDRPTEPVSASRPPRAGPPDRAPARDAARPSGDGPRSLQGDKRHLRAPGRRPSHR